GVALAVEGSRESEDVGTVDVETRHEDGVGPGKFALRYGTDVFINEPDLPFARHERRDEEDPLGRHECLDGPHQGKSVIESAERPRVGRKHTQDVPDTRRAECPYRDRRGKGYRGCQHACTAFWAYTRSRRVYCLNLFCPSHFFFRLSILQST